MRIQDWPSSEGLPVLGQIADIHKPAGLATGALLAAIVYRTHQATPLGLPEIGAIAVTVFLFVATVAAGGLLSADQEAPALVLTLHQVIPVLTVISTAVTLYLLFRGR